MVELEKLVAEAARNAYENGNRVWASAEELAEDMQNCDGEIESYFYPDILKAIHDLSILAEKEDGLWVIRKFWRDDNAPDGV